MKRFPFVALRSACLLALTSALFAAEGPDQGNSGALPYVHMGELDSTLITPDSWYLEERDSLGRPFRATEWREGEVFRLTSWVYEGDNQSPSLMLSTDTLGSSESRYDGDGREITRVVKDSSEKILVEIRREWDPQGRETLRETSEKGKATLERWVYDDQGELRERLVEEGGEKVFQVLYESDEIWFENVYRKGVLILSERYVNGRREARP